MRWLKWLGIGLAVLLVIGLLSPDPRSVDMEACRAEAQRRLMPFRNDYAQMAGVVCGSVQRLVADGTMTYRDALEAGLIIAGAPRR